MTGAEYANRVAAYLARRFGARGLKVYREVRVGKSIIGKNRCLDVFCICERTNRAFAIECKFQDSQGTVDEKIPYALEDLRAMPIPGCIAWAGKGFSEGVRHMLGAARDAAYCLPGEDQTAGTPETRELDHLLAAHFSWWDVLVEHRKPVHPAQVAAPVSHGAGSGDAVAHDPYLYGWPKDRARAVRRPAGRRSRSRL